MAEQRQQTQKPAAGQDAQNRDRNQKPAGDRHESGHGHERPPDDPGRGQGDPLEDELRPAK